MKQKTLIEARPIPQSELGERPDWLKLPEHRWRGPQAPGLRHFRQKDSLKQRVYNAESAWRSKFGQGRKFDTHAEVVRYIRSLFETKWFQRRWGATRMSLITFDRCDGVHSWGRRGQIRILRRHMTEDIVLHEIAHHLAAGHRHWNKWVRVYLELVAFKMGKESAEGLKEQYRKRNISWRAAPNRKSPARAQQSNLPPRYIVLGEDPSGDAGKLVYHERRTKAEAIERLLYLHREGWIALVLVDRCRKAANKMRVDSDEGRVFYAGGESYDRVMGGGS